MQVELQVERQDDVISFQNSCYCFFFGWFFQCLLNSPAGTQLFEFYLRKKHQVTKRSFNQLFFPLSWVLTLVSRVNESYSIWNDEFDLFTDEMTHFRYYRYVKLRHFWLVLNEMNNFRGFLQDTIAFIKRIIYRKKQFLFPCSITFDGSAKFWNEPKLDNHRYLLYIEYCMMFEWLKSV